MRHNTTEILNRIAELAEQRPLNKLECDEMHRLMSRFEDAVLWKMTQSEEKGSAPHLISLKPLIRKHKEI